MSQRDKLRELFAKHGPDVATLVREYARAERNGEVLRRRTSGLNAEEYARRLVADAEKKGWIEGFGAEYAQQSRPRVARTKRNEKAPLRPAPILNISIQRLLRFFDDPDASCSGHASAIAAVAGEDLGAALFAHYVESTGGQAEILPNRCTQGTKSGVRLDRWILVEAPDRRVLYQTEIKNWSAHAIGGRRFDLSPDDSAAIAYRADRWKKEWNGSDFIKKQVRKVLTPMKAPLSDVIVEPLVCFWTALHPTGAPEPFFEVSLEGNKFSRLAVFSMSSYLRQFDGTDTLRLPMRDTARRLKLLAEMFSARTGDSVEDDEGDFQPRVNMQDSAEEL